MILSTEGLSQVTSHKRPDATKSLGLVTVEDKLDVAFTLHRRFDKVQFSPAQNSVSGLRDCGEDYCIRAITHHPYTRPLYQLQEVLRGCKGR